MRRILQSATGIIILAVALLADGLMDALGPWGFLLAAGVSAAIAWALLQIPDRPGKKNAAPGAETSKGGMTSRKG